MNIDKYNSYLERKNIEILTLHFFKEEKITTTENDFLKKNEKKYDKTNDKKINENVRQLKLKKMKSFNKNEKKKTTDRHNFIYRSELLNKELHNFMKGQNFKHTKIPSKNLNKFSKPLKFKTTKNCIVSNTINRHKPLQNKNKFDQKINISNLLNFHHPKNLNLYHHKNINIDYLLSFKNRFNMRKNDIGNLLNNVKGSEKIVCF